MNATAVRRVLTALGVILTLGIAGYLIAYPRNVRYIEDTPLTFQGLPLQHVDTKGMPNNKYQKEYQFRTDWFVRHIPVWEKCLAEYKGKPNLQYLEVGLYEGRSFFWVMENILTDPSCHLTGMDLFADEYLYASHLKQAKEVFFANLKLSGQEKKCTIIQGFSQLELRKLPPESFDIIYIDGSHDPSDVLEDAVQAWRLLKVGGMLIFDDYLLHTTGGEKCKDAIDTFMHFYGKHFEVVHVDWQVFLKKKKPAS